MNVEDRPENIDLRRASISTASAGAVVIRRSRVGRARFGVLEIDELSVKSLTVEELNVTRRIALPDGREYSED